MTTTETPDDDPRPAESDGSGDGDDAATNDDGDDAVDTITTDAPATVDVTVSLDVPRAMMYDELADEFGTEDMRLLLGENLSGTAKQIVTQLYDNRDSVADAAERANTGPQP